MERPYNETPDHCVVSKCAHINASGTLLFPGTRRACATGVIVKRMSMVSQNGGEFIVHEHMLALISAFLIPIFLFFGFMMMFKSMAKSEKMSREAKADQVILLEETNAILRDILAELKRSSTS
jgi:hypothetical protein